MGEIQFRDTDFTEEGVERMYSLSEKLKSDINRFCYKKLADELNMKVDDFILRYENKSLCM